MNRRTKEGKEREKKKEREERREEKKASSLVCLCGGWAWHRKEGKKREGFNPDLVASFFLFPFSFFPFRVTRVQRGMDE